MFKAITRRIRYNRTVSALENLTDRNLRDIGITRGEIKSHARMQVTR